MMILICGSRDWNDAEAIKREILSKSKGTKDCVTEAERRKIHVEKFQS